MSSALRNLAYASLILAGLSVTAHELAGMARANVIGAAAAGRVVAFAGRTALTDDGRFFYLDADNWTQPTQTVGGSNTAPVPASQIAFLGADGTSFIDVNGNGWGWYGGASQGHWINNGPPPGYGPIAVQPTTWSAIKGSYAGPK